MRLTGSLRMVFGVKTRKWLKLRLEIFFKTIFDEELGLQVRLDNVGFNTIYSDDNVMLVGAFSEEEVKNVVWSCNSSKSSGSDGFNFGFPKFCWDCLKEDILVALNDSANSRK